MNTLGDKFSNHIKTVFEEFDTEGADYGWTELRKNFPQKSSHRQLYLWLSGVAASLLIAGILVFNSYHTDSLKQEKLQTTATKTAPSAPQKTGGTKKELKAPTSSRYKEIGPVSAKASVIAAKSIARVPAVKEKNPINLAKQQSVAINDRDTGIIKKSDITDKSPITASGIAKAETVKDEALTTLQFLEKENEKLKKENKSLLASTGKKGLEKGKNALFDVYTATFLNYYADNPVKVNAGAGFNANIRINKNVYLSMGAGISETKISYQNTTPSSLLSYSRPLENIALQNGYLTQANSAKLDARFLNIDIPVAVKFYPGKSGKYYLATGINSSTYLNQKYSSSLSVYSPASDSFTDLRGETEKNNLKGFNFANSAIFAIGINQPLGKSSILTFEPFFRPSLRGYGDKGVKINTAGLNLKLSLGGKR